MKAGDVLSYLDMCRHEGVNLQRGMNFRLRGKESVILMSVRAGAPYSDRVEDNGNVLIYEGHDIPARDRRVNPKAVDQQANNPSGSLTQNGRFFKAALDFKTKGTLPERVRVYEKIRDGIWVYNGNFNLVDAWTEDSNARKVFKFKLCLVEDVSITAVAHPELEHERVIPSEVKRAVWIRDKGRCVTCDSGDNLHFDHIIPYSKGGSSLVVENIQIMCARHNLAKSNNIE